MMCHIKANGSMQLTGNTVRLELPEIVVQMHDSLVAVQLLDDARWFTINDLQVSDRMLLQRRLDRRAIVLPRQHPDAVVLAQFPHDVPADAWLGTFSWPAGIGGHENVE
jgi:hypothetical protein